MRLALYIATFAFFALTLYFKEGRPELAQKIFNIWAFAFIAICIDIIARLRKSIYLFFPIGYALITFYRYLDLPYNEYANLLGGLLHIALALLFLKVYIQTPKEDQEMRSFFLITAIFLVLFATRILLFFFPDVTPLTTFFDLQLSSYILVAYSGRMLILNRLIPDYPRENVILVLIIVIHGLLIVQELIHNFFV